MNKKIIRTALALLFISLLITAPRAQQPAPLAAKQSPDDRIALYQALLDLTNPWTVMCIAAHPDDEDGTSLIVMRRKYGAHTVSLFSTFGEGGQNAIGPDLYEELGAIRARETMAAAEIQGSEPHFLGLKDFGFSKSADEAFKFWGHDEALRRMVLQIRKLRPDVIITNHSVTNNDHGHHQATARLELEAFDAAADPNRFPEQLKGGVTTWQVQRLFVRVRGSAAQNPDRQGGGEQVVTIDPNERDPVRGVVYAEEALRALQQHATQGPWPKTFAEFTARFRAFSGQGGATGPMPLIRYRLEREAKGVDALPNDSHNFLDGLQLPQTESAQITPPTIEGGPLTDFIDQRDQILDVLLVATQKHVFGKEFTTSHPERIPSDSRRISMLNRLKNALAVASGIDWTLHSEYDALIPGETASFTLTITNKGTRPAKILLAESGARDEKGTLFIGTKQKVNDKIVDPGQVVNIPFEYKTSPQAKFTIPHADHLYDPFLALPVAGGAWIGIGNVKLPIAGFLALDVVPPVEILGINPSLAVVTPISANRPLNLTVRVVNHTRKVFLGRVTVEQAGATTKATSVSLTPGQSSAVTVEADSQYPPRMNPPPEHSIKVGVYSSDGSSVITKREVRAVYANANVASNISVGYIRGFDFSLPNALTALGVESKELTVEEVKTADLQKYTSIIVDNRVYESQPQLIAANQKLLDYAKDGGTLIVFYHKSNEWNPDERRKRPQLAPYKLILGDERVTDETAPITFIEPEHPLLNFPNKLGQEDFANWIQERGLYYPKDWDPQYHALLQSNDPGEAPLKGGLLVADYGRGHYIYSSMVWYRELRGGVPGAYRMLANMISYGQAEGKSKK